MPDPKVIAVHDLPTADAKWVKLKKCTWQDPDGTERLWEYAERPTRSAGGIDAVAILALLRSQSGAFAPSTVIIEQFRPPVERFVVGLIDKSESPEQAAIRELEEETGLKASAVIGSTPVMVCDPGMTNANMKLVTIEVSFPDKLEMAPQKLEPGEYIVVRVVELSKLGEVLRGSLLQKFVVDARLEHLASGYELAEKLRH
ncbi:NUDIX hydrolase domain-like protein [Epithele typhae]|uniref:NUDIX hydrolase domain-like protein n=1 Tax=Epithele typhae TaxID=378194 RepID=UPI0020084139|nr:NUDIX hydrolase domain-like protein [Epithele typhae]KAH9946397.1 NUDIX hydrolase domain-like protein [Epithele typhae]